MSIKKNKIPREVLCKLRAERLKANRRYLEDHISKKDVPLKAEIYLKKVIASLSKEIKKLEAEIENVRGNN